MAIHPPARVGDSIENIDTPALLVDLDVLEANINLLARNAEASGVRVRPHAKTHKCPAIALRQIRAGAVGVCCQKVSEAEVMVDHGIADVLVTNEIVGEVKVRRLVELATRATVAVCADHPANVAELSECASAAGVTLPVFVEVNVGLNRCGVEPGQPAVALARAIVEAPSLAFGGIHAYLGSAQHLRGYAEREAAVAREVEAIGGTRRLLENAGIDCPTVTGAGSGTYRFEAASGLYNEIQPGSYVLMDADYGRNLGSDGEPWHEFGHALFVLAAVMSTPTHDRAIVDAGLKVFSVDSGMPTVAGVDGVEYTRANDEHGYLDLTSAARRPALGEKIRLIPGHCDPTVNLHDWIIAFRGDRVEEVWPVAARGAIF